MAAEHTESAVCGVNKYCNTDDERFNEEMYNRVKEVSHLVTVARLQSAEAEIRARYAAQFAERAVSEAHSAHEVCASLAKTSRVVASLALDLANSDSFPDDGTDERSHAIFSDFKTSFQSGDHSNDLTSPSSECKNNSKPHQGIAPTLFPVGKYLTPYPDDLPIDEGTFEIKLPTVWEDDSPKGTKADIVELQSALSEKRRSRDIRKTLELYKDSKLMQRVNPLKYIETGDSQQPTYENKGSQTCIGEEEETAEVIHVSEVYTVPEAAVY